PAAPADAVALSLRLVGGARAGLERGAREARARRRDAQKRRREARAGEPVPGQVPGLVRGRPAARATEELVLAPKRSQAPGRDGNRAHDHRLDVRRATAGPVRPLVHALELPPRLPPAAAAR